MKIFKYEEILDQLLSIAFKAGDEVLKIYNADKKIKINTKEDLSPVTEADMVSHQFICESLTGLDLNLPILSEESIHSEFHSQHTLDSYWLVDPLDGTKEFIKRNGQFTINIALIEKNKPTIGIVYAPAINLCYYAVKNLGAYKIEAETKIRIRTRDKILGSVVVVTSHYEKSPQLDSLLKAIGPHSLTAMGSSIKICLVAEGKADLYPRLFPTSIWDTAAAHCILLEAGGDLYDVQQKTSLIYDAKTSLLNPSFIALSQANKKWLDLI